jgi:hypothetical protein
MTNSLSSNHSQSYIWPTPPGWEDETWRKVSIIAEKMTRQELIIAWLDSYPEMPDDDFNVVLKQYSKWLRQELIDLIHEIEQDGGEKLIKRYGYYLEEEKK